MYSTSYNLWTFTWFVHFELPFRLKGTEKKIIPRDSLNSPLIYSILYGFNWTVIFNTLKYTKKKGTVENLNNFSLKTRPEQKKIANFLITVLRIFYDSLIQSLQILDFDRHNFYIHMFAFLNFWFWEKKGSRIFFWAIGVPKKLLKNIGKTPYRRVAQKRYNFALGALYIKVKDLQLRFLHVRFLQFMIGKYIFILKICLYLLNYT